MVVPERKDSYVDVLIVGAGPSGLMAANALVRAGVNVRIVDQKPHPVLTGQAGNVAFIRLQGRLLNFFAVQMVFNHALLKSCRYA
jgi:phenol 2-monooxygenase